ncbi:G-protein coupled receptor Mth-like [Chironomus tepperi]|uniref:G-protein coupled receptor Mth-like n=1 Tax=Chironomus tepperi TaxID=113505 RepID=UPI00391EE95C
MNKNFIVSVIVIIIYGILFGLFLKFYEKSNYNCQSNSFCIRICSTNESQSNDLLLNEFDKSEPYKITKSRIKYHEIFRGPLTCDKTSSTSEYDFDLNGRVVVAAVIYYHREYCLQHSESNFKEWILKICDRDYNYIFNVIGYFISIFLLLFTTIVYIFYKELRDVYGKFIILFVLSQIVALVLHTCFVMSQEFDIFNPLYNSIFLASMMNILLYITAMISHSFNVLINFKKYGAIPFEFWQYNICIFICQVFVGVLFVVLFKTLDVVIILALLFVFIWITDFIILIITGIQIFIISRRLSHSEQSRFDEHLKWYWICVKLYFIMLVTIPYEIYIFTSDFNFYFLILASFINVFTAFVITITLLGRKNVKILLFKKYRGFIDDEETQEFGYSND